MCNGGSEKKWGGVKRWIWDEVEGDGGIAPCVGSGGRRRREKKNSCKQLKSSRRVGGEGQKQSEGWQGEAGVR